jgi:hypothetical protein
VNAGKLVVWMWKLGSNLLRVLNPLRPYLDYRQRRDLHLDRQRELERMERADERELFRQTIESMSRMVEKAFDVNKVQQEAFARWMASFDTTEAPKVREYDEDEDNKRYMERKGGQTPRKHAEPTLPPELSGLSQIQQFELLLDRMGS